MRNSAVVSTLSAAYTYDPNYQSTPPPSIAALQPDTGPLSGGTVLWLTGANLVSGSKVYFGSNAAVEFVLADASHAVVTAPPGSAAGFVDVNIVNPNGQAGALLRGFSYVADANIPGLAPKLTSVTPATGPESSDTVAILTGNNFVNGEYVFVGAAQGAGVRLLSSSIIDNTFPHQPAGVVDVAVTDPTGRSSVLHNSFTFLARPTLQSVANSTPGTNAGASGPTVGGTPVTIAGTGFQNGATVTFGLVPATAVQVASSDVLTCVTPAGVAGPADVQLINPDGQTAVLTGGWLYVPPPGATSLTPPTGPLHGGTIAVLAGANFSPQATVTVGGVLANTLFGSPGSVVVYVPAGVNAGPVDVVIKNPDGQTSTLHGGFTYSTGPFGNPPHISLIQPSSGPDTGGTMVVINGSNYTTGAIGIVGGNLLSRTLLVGPGAMTGFTAAAAVDGATLVAVTNPDGQSASLPTGFTYVNPATLVSTPPPVVTGAVPSQALAPGGSAVAILGTGFSTGVVAPLVFLQGIPSNVSNGTANQINVTTPAAQPGPADIVVVNPDGQTGIAAGAFTFLVPPPVFASQNPIAPVKGPTAGGTVVVITGSYFQPPVQVFFGNSPGSVNTSAAATNANQITVTTPPGIAGNVAVLVTNKDGQSASLPGAFYYQPPPVLTSVTPPSGSPNGGNTVTLNGQYFSGSAAQMSVKFGAAAATITGTPTANIVEAVVPSSTAAGALTVAVTVTNDDGQSVTVPGAYIYLPPPAPPQVLGVTPNAGSTTGGATVTVLGENFQFGARVFFGNSCSATPNTCIEATTATVISDSAISCVVPAASAPGTVGITVENPDTNEASLASAFTYVAGPPPAQLHVGSIVPNAGAIAGGTEVFIGGNGFENGATATLVPYDGTTCPPNACNLLNVTVLGPTAIEAVMPPQPVNSTALFNLIVANPGGASNELFKAYSYGNGTRHFRATGLRLPLESHAGKYNRSVSGRYATAWSGVVGDFTRLTNPAGVSDVFIGGWAGRNPRLYQANFDPTLPAGAKARVFTDLTSNLHNYDGTPMQDDCCGTTNDNYSYDVVEPRTADFDNNGQADIAFWNDYNNGFTIFWNQGGILTARAYGGGTPTDWQAFDWQGKLLDFNLDGSPDFLFVTDDSPTYLMLGCGGTTPNPAGGAPLPKPAALGCILTSTGAGVNVAITPGAQTFHTSAPSQNYNFSNTNFAQYMIPGTSRWIVDSGTNTEIVTISAATSNTFTATFVKSHAANTQWAPVINAVSSTNVTTTGSATVVTLNTMDGWGGACNIGLVVNPGLANEERINGQGCTATNYANKTVSLTFAKTHTAPFTITVEDPHTLPRTPPASSSATARSRMGTPMRRWRATSTATATSTSSPPI